MIDKNRFAETLFFVLALALFLLMIVPSLAGMPVIGDDAVLHLQWIAEFNKLKDAGIFYPRFFSDFQHGFGAPIFYFYPPFAYFAAWTVHFYFHSLSPNGLLQSVTFFATVASALSFYGYSEVFSESKLERWSAALLYAGFPYRFVDAYLRSAFSEHVSFIWIPLIFLAVEKIRSDAVNNRTSTRPLVLLAVSWAALIVTSIPMTAIVAIAFVPYVLLRVPLTTGTISRIALASVLGALATSFYLVPLFAYLPLIQHGNVFRYPNEFRYPLYFLTQSRTESILLPSIILIVGIASIAVARKSANKAVPGLLALAAVFQLPWIADPLWNGHVLDAIVYPVRFTALFCLAFPLAYLTLGARERTYLIIAVGALVIVSGYYEVKWSVHHRSTPAIEVQNAEWDTPGEYTLSLPKTVDEKTEPLSPGERVAEIRHEPIQEIRHEPLGSQYAVSLTAPRSFPFDRTYWPTWKAATSSGTNIPLRMNAMGRVEASLPAGNYTLALTMQPGAPQIAGTWLSALTILILLTAWFYRRKAPLSPEGTTKE